MRRAHDADDLNARHMRANRAKLRHELEAFGRRRDLFRPSDTLSSRVRSLSNRSLLRLACLWHGKGMYGLRSIVLTLNDVSNGIDKPGGGKDFERIPEGTVRWLLSRGRTYHDPAGHPVRSRGIIIDITETHETGERYVVTNPMALEDPLDRAADIAITLKRMLGEVAPAEVRASVDLLLLSLGGAIARGSGSH